MYNLKNCHNLSFVSGISLSKKTLPCISFRSKSVKQIFEYCQQMPLRLSLSFFNYMCHTSYHYYINLFLIFNFLSICFFPCLIGQKYSITKIRTVYFLVFRFPEPYNGSFWNNDILKTLLPGLVPSRHGNMKNIGS